MSEAIKAYRGDGTSVVYEYADGRRETWRGGARAWRNRNPGNVVYVATNRWKGQIGFAGSFCCFSSPVWGVRAMGVILRAYGRRGMTLAGGIARYAPSVENDTEAYVRAVVKASGVGGGRMLSGLSEAEMALVVKAMTVHEGYEEGVVEEV